MQEKIAPNNLMLTALKIIKHFEGLRTTAYLCPARKWTVGYGHVIIINGHMATESTHTFESLPLNYQCINSERADELLMAELVPYINNIKALTTQQLNDNQFAAITSFAYNCGVGAYKISSLRKYINQNTIYDANRISDLFGKWKFAGGKPLKGLEARRKAEAALFSY